jgi:hypothetical protein
LLSGLLMPATALTRRSGKYSRSKRLRSNLRVSSRLNKRLDLLIRSRSLYPR